MTSPAPSRLGLRTILGLFVGALVVLAVVVAIFVLLNQPPGPVPPCEPGRPCAPQASLPPVAETSPPPTAQPTSRPTGLPTGRPTGLPTVAPSSPIPTPAGTTPTPFVPPPTPGSDSPPFVAGEVWRSPTLGYSFEYDRDQFQLTESADDVAVFGTTRFDGQVIVRGAPGSVTPADLIGDQLQVVDGFMIGRTPDDDDYDALLGPSIGYLRGEGDVFAGTLLSSDGTPVVPGGVTVLASTDGRITVVILVIVGRPDLDLGSDTHQHVVRSLADDILKTFDWGEAP